MNLRLSLSQRLGAVFAGLLLACCGAAVWLQVHANERHAQVVTQRLSSGLAAHIARSAPLMQPDGLNQPAVRELFHKLMDVNPSVEVYLLAPDGRIVAQDAPAGHLRRERVDVAPIRTLLAGGELPVLGDDPRSDQARKVFNAAPLRFDGRDAGYVYVVLHGEALETLARDVTRGDVVSTALWAIALIGGCVLLAGLAAFRWITRPLRALIADVRHFRLQRPAPATPAAPTDSAQGDEIALLRSTFGQMTQRIDEQWRELAAQDRQRRELVANISHDLRTPLTSLHGYLETLRVKADTLPAAERQRYLDVALAQSRKVGRLAEALFDLARLECGAIKLERQRFSVADLVQDVAQKFELALESRRLTLTPVIAPDVPVVAADVGLIERVLTNLLDNAIKHTPPGGRIEVEVNRQAEAVELLVSDTGPGIPAAVLQSLFVRPSFANKTRAGGGLGLVIVKRILQLHGGDIRLVRRPAWGAAFEVRLPA